MAFTIIIIIFLASGMNTILSTILVKNGIELNPVVRAGEWKEGLKQDSTCVERKMPTQVHTRAIITGNYRIIYFWPDKGVCSVLLPGVLEMCSFIVKCPSNATVL